MILKMRDPEVIFIKLDENILLNIKGLSKYFDESWINEICSLSSDEC